MADGEDPRTPRPRDVRAARMTRDAAIRRAEQAMEEATDAALNDLLRAAAAQLAAANYDPAVLDSRNPEWAAIVESQVLPEVTAAYVAGLHLEVLEGTIDGTAYAARHLETVRNRLVGVADQVFDTIRVSLRDGWLAGEDIPTLASRVDSLLGDAPRWRNRATTIARTEVIGANNAGARDAARYAAGVIGHDVTTVVKQWLATSDARTRETHAEVDGTQVAGIDGQFTVGGYALTQPGDPAGPPGEVVNCRCTVLYLMPGDPGYPTDPTALTAGGTMTALAPETETPPEDTVTPPEPDANGEVRWPFHGVAIVEGIKTGDGRKFTNLSWVDPPLSFRAQFSEQVGHDGAVAVGRIETMTRDGDRITFTGTWDDESLNEDAARARRFNLNGQMRGVSFDGDEGTISFEDGDGNPLDSDDLWDLGPEDEVVMAVDGARVRAVTACMIPAFIEAYCLDDTLPESAAPTESVTAAAGPTGAGLTAAALLAEPEVRGDAAPTAAFHRPADERLTHPDGSPRSLNVAADGTIAGYVATWGTCHIGHDGVCVDPPHSATNYAYFLTGEYLTRDGDTVPVGVLTMDTGHAGDTLSAGATIAHYDNTGTVAGYVTVGEDDRGIWQAGIIRPGLPREKVELLRASGKVSGDWRRLGGNLELVANLACNVAGFPVPAVRSRVAAGHPVSLVAAGMVSGDDAPVTRGDLSRLIREGIGRDLRARAASTRIRRARARTLVARIDRAGRG